MKNNFLSSLIYCAAFISILTTVSCKSEKTVSQTEEQFIVSYSFIDFGYGGGFAGKYDYYRLMDNGNLWKLENDSPTVRIKQIKAESLKSIDELAQDLIESDFQIDMMGNMTYFLKIRKENADFNYKWMEEVEQPITKASILHDKLNEFIVESKNK